MSPLSDAQREPVATWGELARLPDDAIDVAVGAALIARDTNESTDVRAVLRSLDELAAPLVSAGLENLTPAEQVEAVSARFRELGFRGNVDDYYDPRNSFLPDVIERRLGIPISLTIVWCELARRAGVHARGVGFPGHFLARVDDRSGVSAPVIVDPFEGGRVIDDLEAKVLLKRALGEGPELHPSLFAPASARSLLVRMLSNLKAIWASRGDHARAFMAVDRIVTLVPSSPRDLRERAAIALRLGIPELAKADLSRVLELEPQAPDVPQIRERLLHLDGSTSTRPLN